MKTVTSKCSFTKSLSRHISLCIYVYIYIICLSVYLSVCLSICLSVCLSIRVYPCLSVYLSIYLSIYKVREKLRVWFFPIPQVTWNRNKHRTWLDFMLISFPSIWSWFRRLCIAILFELLLLLFKIDFTQGFRFHFWCEDEAVLVEVNLVQGFTPNPDLNVCFESDGGKNLQIEIFVLQHFFFDKKN